MTKEISFISAGEDEIGALGFLLKFVEEKFLELQASKAKILRELFVESEVVNYKVSLDNIKLLIC